MTTSQRILVIDDEAALREVLCTVFANRGYEAIDACSTDQAHNLLQDFDPHLVITDFNMKNGDNGIKALQAVRAVNPEIPVMVRTGDEGFIKSGDWRELGFDAGSFKLGHKDYLIAQVEFLLQGKLRILVIDPNEGIQDLLPRMFRQVANCATKICSSAVEAMQEIDGMSYHLVTTSNNFGKLNGTDVANLIRQTGIKTPIAMISGSVTKEEFPCENGIFFARIPKPVRTECLGRLLKAL